jgi:hypothetical protein
VHRLVPGDGPIGADGLGESHAALKHRQLCVRSPPRVKRGLSLLFVQKTMSEILTDEKPEEPKRVPGGPIIRGALNTFGGLIPVVGSVLSAAAGAWSEQEQEKYNQFIKQWIQMLEDELKEKAQTVLEIMSRLDVHDEEIRKRISSDEYQSLLRKGFREWSAAESESKRILFRNILSNAAASKIVSDDVVRLFLDWLKMYSELHFAVVGKIYNNSG